MIDRTIIDYVMAELYVRYHLVRQHARKKLS